MRWPRWSICCRRCRCRNRLSKLLILVFAAITVAVIYCNMDLLHEKNDILKLSFWRNDAKTDTAQMRGRQTNEQTCLLPSLALWIPEVQHSVKPVAPIQCSDEPDWVTTKSGRVYFSSVAEQRHGKIKCAAVPIVNKHDWWATLPMIPLRNGSELSSDAVKIGCKAADGQKYENIHATVVPVNITKPIRKRVKSFNFLIFGFDSISRQMFKRLLPRTDAYFTKTLGGHVLEGYNIVGDGTPAALMPILAGRSETEVPEVRKGRNGTHYVDDVMKFIWKRFERRGYVTGWYEDLASIGTFNFRMAGFRHQPVKHYMRAFLLNAPKMYRKFGDKCLGARTSFQVYMDWLEDFLLTYKQHNFFNFGFFSEYSHNNNSMLALADQRSLRFLQFLNQGGFLANTILILMSDHGLRVGPFRRTEQGKLEERMPYFGFYFPPSFVSKYPKKMRTFNTNIRKLTTPFDIHETFLDILGELDPQNKKGISLFRPIPPERTCISAGIESHWCACLKWKLISVSDENATIATSSVISLINDKLLHFLKLCRLVKLNRIITAKVFETSDDVLKFKQSSDMDGRVADLSDEMRPTERMYQVTFETVPGRAVYEASVKLNLNTGRFFASDTDISRLNKYGERPRCIADRHPRLRPYCVCRHSPETRV